MPKTHVNIAPKLRFIVIFCYYLCVFVKLAPKYLWYQYKVLPWYDFLLCHNITLWQFCVHLSWCQCFQSYTSECAGFIQFLLLVMLHNLHLWSLQNHSLRLQTISIPCNRSMSTKTANKELTLFLSVCLCSTNLTCICKWKCFQCNSEIKTSDELLKAC